MENETELEIYLEEEQELGMEWQEEIVEVSTNDYNKLLNIPRINQIEVLGDKTAKELKLQEELDVISNLEIEKILNL